MTGTATSTNTYYDMAGERIGVSDGTTLTVLATDHLGSTAGSYSVTDDGTEGQTVRRHYYPFGQERLTDGGQLPTDFTFTGQKDDHSTGLMFYNARYYDPVVRRFISPDTVVPDWTNPQDLNRYSYVRNNPMRFIDSSGHEPVQAYPDWANPTDSIERQVAALLVDPENARPILTGFGLSVPRGPMTTDHAKLAYAATVDAAKDLGHVRDALKAAKTIETSLVARMAGPTKHPGRDLETPFEKARRAALELAARSVSSAAAARHLSRSLPEIDQGNSEYARAFSFLGGNSGMGGLYGTCTGGNQCDEFFGTTGMSETIDKLVADAEKKRTPLSTRVLDRSPGFLRGILSWALSP